MSLSEILTKRRSELVKKWIEAVVNSYPDDTARFLQTKKDRFLNPVGHTINTELEALYDALAGDKVPQEEIMQCLDRLIRIRALQSFKASDALRFIFALKHILREDLEKELAYGKMATEMLKLEADIDRLGLMAFDVYMSCREQIYDLKCKDMRNLYAAAIRRAGVEFETPEK